MTQAGAGRRRLRERVYADWNWWPINRPYVQLCDPDDGEIWVNICWGNSNSDPVWALGYLFSGLPARPFIAWANRRWDRAYARQEARRHA